MISRRDLQHASSTYHSGKEIVMSDCFGVSREDGIATVALSRGKVNALNEAMVEELHAEFQNLERDKSVLGVVLTGTGKFFSFGFDIPEFLGYSREEFTRYLRLFARCYTHLFLFPKPVIAALNGHTIAGGCMLASACDFRFMAAGKGKISLNEINFGSSVFAGSVAMLKECVGSKAAAEILYSGAMYSPEDALRLGLVDKVVAPEDLLLLAVNAARDPGGKNPAAFGSIKRLLRQPVADAFVACEDPSIREFVEIWYSPETWKNLQEIKIAS